jgi:hypothetical protein
LFVFLLSISLHIISIILVIKYPNIKASRFTNIKPYKTFFHSLKLIAEKFPIKAMAAPDIPAINAWD